VRVRSFVVVAALLACTTPEPDAIPNVRLGMAPRDVRERFEPGGAGTWQTSVARAEEGGDTAIEWAASGPAKIATARFEFHLGMLVAMRVRTNDPSSSETVSTTAKTVTARRPAAEGGTNVTILARDCPTHKDEADALTLRAKR
jgi:hypothetical protein